MRIEFEIMDRATAVETALDAVMGSYAYTGSHDKTFRMVKVGTYAVPVGYKKWSCHSFQSSDSKEETTPLPSVDAVREVLGWGMDLQYFAVFYSRWHLGANSPPRWGVQVHISGWHWSHDFLVINCQEVSGVPETGDDPFSLAWALTHAKKKIRVGHITEEGPKPLLELALAVNEAARIFQNGLPDLGRLGNKLLSKPPVEIVLAWAKAACSKVVWYHDEAGTCLASLFEATQASDEQEARC